MLTSERRALIIDRLRTDGRIVAKQLAEELSLSEDTIRKDLREMAADGLLARVHGGALPVSPELPNFEARRSVASAEKRRLGERAAGLVQPGQTIFIDGGTTNAELARKLPRHFGFTIFTHSPSIAMELEHHPTAEVILIGGRLFRHSMVVTGAEALKSISRIRPDIFFLGVTAVHPHHGFSTGDYEEAAIKREIAAQSRDTWVLLTSAKLDALSPITIMPITSATGVVLQDGAEEAHLKMLQETGVDILTTGSTG